MFWIVRIFTAVQFTKIVDTASLTAKFRAISDWSCRPGLPNLNGFSCIQFHDTTRLPGQSSCLFTTPLFCLLHKEPCTPDLNGPLIYLSSRLWRTYPRSIMSAIPDDLRTCLMAITDRERQACDKIALTSDAVALNLLPLLTGLGRSGLKRWHTTDFNASARFLFSHHKLPAEPHVRPRDWLLP